MQSTLTSPALPSYSFADLDAYDEKPRDFGRERRYLCPLCGDSKPRNDEHRCLCVNVESGLWKCQRCDARGKLRDFWTDSTQSTLSPSRARDFARQRRARLSLVEAPPAQSEATDWRHRLRGLRPLHDTVGAKYFDARGISCEVAHAAGARFAPDFYGRPAVVFPIRNRQSTLVAATGRYIDGRDTPKTRTTGPKRDGVFFAPVQAQTTLPSGRRVFAPFDKDLPAIIVVEAPIDALSLATAGYPAIALCGTSGPTWLRMACGFRRVLLGFDADDAGDNAAALLSGDLVSYGATCERLRPEGANDFSEVLCSGDTAALSDWLAWRVLLDAPARAQVKAWPGETLFDE